MGHARAVDPEHAERVPGPGPFGAVVLAEACPGAVGVDPRPPVAVSPLCGGQPEAEGPPAPPGSSAGGFVRGAGNVRGVSSDEDVVADEPMAIVWDPDDSLRQLLANVAEREAAKAVRREETMAYIERVMDTDVRTNAEMAEIERAREAERAQREREEEAAYFLACPW